MNKVNFVQESETRFISIDLPRVSGEESRQLHIAGLRRIASYNPGFLLMWASVLSYLKFPGENRYAEFDRSSFLIGYLINF